MGQFSEEFRFWIYYVSSLDAVKPRANKSAIQQKIRKKKKKDYLWDKIVSTSNRPHHLYNVKPSAVLS